MSDADAGDDSTLVVWAAAVGVFAAAGMTWARRSALRVAVTGETPLRRVVRKLEGDADVLAHARLARQGAKAGDKQSDEDALELERLSHAPSVVALKRAKEMLAKEPPNAAQRARAAALKSLAVVAAVWAVSLALFWFGAATMAQPFDPYVILNVPRDASTSDVKRAFRKLSMELHPDRWSTAAASARQEAASKFTQVAKAYKTLTDDEAKKNWIEHGHPDGHRGMHVSTGIPRWMRDDKNAAAVLAGYVLFIAVLGFGVMKWMYSVLEQNQKDAEAEGQGGDSVEKSEEDVAEALLRGDIDAVSMGNGGDGGGNGAGKNKNKSKNKGSGGGGGGGKKSR